MKNWQEKKRAVALLSKIYKIHNHWLWHAVSVSGSLVALFGIVSPWIPGVADISVSKVMPFSMLFISFIAAVALFMFRRSKKLSGEVVSCMKKDAVINDLVMDYIADAEKGLPGYGRFLRRNIAQKV